MRGRFGASARDIKTGWNLHGNFSFQMRYDLAQSQEVPRSFADLQNASAIWSVRMSARHGSGTDAEGGTP
jgi:hypothetical protein